MDWLRCSPTEKLHRPSEGLWRPCNGRLGFGAPWTFYPYLIEPEDSRFLLFFVLVLFRIGEKDSGAGYKVWKLAVHRKEYTLGTGRNVDPGCGCPSHFVFGVPSVPTSEMTAEDSSGAYVLGFYSGCVKNKWLHKKRAVPPHPPRLSFCSSTYLEDNRRPRWASFGVWHLFIFPFVSYCVSSRQETRGSSSLWLLKGWFSVFIRGSGSSCRWQASHPIAAFELPLRKPRKTAQKDITVWLSSVCCVRIPRLSGTLPIAMLLHHLGGLSWEAELPLE